MLRGLRAIVDWGWSPILITALAVVGLIYEWPIELIAPLLGAILVIGLVAVVIKARERQQELVSQKLRQLAGYFTRRFTGNSSLSIFAIIDSLFKLDNPQVWEWARACDMSQRIFNTWCNSYLDRVENDTRTGRFNIYLRLYLNELWLVNNHYYEFVEQFYEIAQKVEIPSETRDQYARFIVEYNTFIGSFQESIAELKKTARTEIEPPSVKLARELPVAPAPKAVQKVEVKPPQPAEHKGYIIG
jgi:hypothetical protein